MLTGILILLVCQVIGEAIAYTLPLPVPGAVIGMVVMFVYLVWQGCGKGNEPHHAEQPALTSSDFLLRNLSLLFVPAGVGVMQKLDIIAAYGLALLVAIVVSTVVTLVVTVATFSFISRLILQGRADSAP